MMKRRGFFKEDEEGREERRKRRIGKVRIRGMWEGGKEEKEAVEEEEELEA